MDPQTALYIGIAIAAIGILILGCTIALADGKGTIASNCEGFFCVGIAALICCVLFVIGGILVIIGVTQL